MEARRRRYRVKTFALVLLAACGSSSTNTPVGTRVAPVLEAALTAADEAKAPWRCAAADVPALPDETIKLGHTWKLGGHALTLDGTGTVTIGVIADAGGAAPTTLAALGRLRGKLGDVDLLVSLGGMGASQAEIEATLGALAERAKFPVVALAGDLEPAPDHTAAIAALRKRGLAVIDARAVRTIALPGATIATVPGAGSLARLAAGADGCGYRSEDVSAILTDLAARPGLRILVSSEAPRDAAAGDPAGELALVPGAGQAIDVRVHGPVEPDATPARGGARDGAGVALSPGTSDATTRLPGPRHAPSAGILTVAGATWRWQPLVDPN
jgi:hypothetical protein